MEFSARQAWAATACARPGIHHVMVGPAQSGKSEAAAAAVGQHCIRALAGRRGGLIARSQAQLDAVLLPKLRAWCARHRLEPRPRRAATELMTPHVPVILQHIIAADGLEAAAGRVQGMTLDLLWADELTRIPWTLLEMLMTRQAAVRNPKIVSTLNPAGPHHWALTDVIRPIVADRSLGSVTAFAMSDNPIMTPEMIERERARYSGPFALRMIEGIWASTEGAVWPRAVVVSGPPEPEGWWEVGIDVGAATVTAAVLLRCTPSGSTVIDEWSHDATLSGQRPMSAMAADIVRWASGWGRVSTWCVPRDGAGIADDLHRLVDGDVVHADDDVLDGIMTTRRRLDAGTLTVHERCRGLLREMSAWVWDAAAAERGVDRPDQASAWGAHRVDALRYAIQTAELARGGLVEWVR